MTPPLDPHVVEDLVISASREFYDNAEEGNLNEGEMKLAFEWCAFLPLLFCTPFLFSLSSLKCVIGGSKVDES